MTLDIETVIERRQLRRRLGIWRLAALVLGLLIVLGLSARLSQGLGPLGRPHIARIDFSGLITDDRKQIELLRKVGEAENVSAVILAINSPGGTTTGGEALFEAIRHTAEKKPVVAVFGTMATSAAYMIGLASDRIVARGNTITGSVGVIFQLPEISGLMDKLGVHMTEVKSGPLKAVPSMFEPLDPAGRAVAEDVVRETQGWFLSLVRERRGIDTAAVDGLEAGRIFSGRQALAHRLVDEIGGEREAIAWLVTEKKLPEGLDVVDWRPEGAESWSLLGGRADGGGSIVDALARALAGGYVEDRVLQRLKLDGLLSVWHAEVN
ncbi:MAG: signal peptide peptidase SppA [Hyphomicrobiaceae bacterium]